MILGFVAVLVGQRSKEHAVVGEWRSHVLALCPCEAHEAQP